MKLLNRLQDDIQKNSSYLNLILGALIVFILGVLVFNYFKQGRLGPSQQAGPQTQGDVSKDQLPGKYTVKPGDTLFMIAQKYYDDGYQYPKLVEVNKLVNENLLEVGQVLEISKLEQASPSPTPQEGTGGAENVTAWGERITGDSYIVMEGDWLSKIAGRAYGDPMAFDKIAKANNLQNADLIEVGQVLKIPR